MEQTQNGWLKKLIQERRQAKVSRENQQGKLLADDDIFHDAIAAKLTGLADTPQVRNFLRCGSEEIFRTCKCCGQLERFTYRCNVKWCPRCQWRIAERRRELISTWAKRITQPKHLVLTCKNFPVLTVKTLKNFQRAMAKLRRTLCFEKVRGGAVSIEITNEGNGWHVHSHWLIDARWLDMEAISVTWGNLVGQSFAIVKIKDVRGREYCSEVCKYLAKGSEVASWQPDQINEFILAIRGRRFFFAFGDLFKQGKAVRAEIASNKPPQTPCDCGITDFLYESEVSAILNEIRKGK